MSPSITSAGTWMIRIHNHDVHPQNSLHRRSES